ncbi:MAG: hypothetical protein ACYC9J_13955 [Sulfuricaulis sp.]
MSTVYILGAGFSKTCGIATDLEMLDSLNPMLTATIEKTGGPPRTTIEYLREQSFLNQREVGFELFMSTLSSLKFSAEYLGPGKNVFREEEKELRNALRTYLKSCVGKVNWEIEGKTVLDFIGRVDWERDFVLTFNYDLLLETAAIRIGLTAGERIIHLHGAIGERTLAWPTYTKFAYRTIKVPLAPRWKRAFNILRNQAEIDRLVFIGYSMPPSDLEAKSLFNYADWYNSMEVKAFYDGKLVPADKHYSYQIIVVNPCKKIAPNYEFFRKAPVFLPLTLEKWLKKSE